MPEPFSSTKRATATTRASPQLPQMRAPSRPPLYFWQELAPKGSEATALALPRAIGDAVYIVAPFALGVVTDTVPIRGAECAIACTLSLVGISLLALLGESGETGGAEIY